jgi:hypothetical protein
MGKRYRQRTSLLAAVRRQQRFAASRHAEEIEAKLQAHLTEDQWQEVQARWDARPELYLPEQKLDFFIGEAVRLDLLDVVPVSALVAS